MSSDWALLRKGLWPLGAVYGVAAALRGWMFSAGLRPVHRAGVRVVSVGNLAAGGTGKTPLVAWLVGEAQRLGLRPAVLARGYRRAPGAALNDEGLMLARRFPELLQVQDPDRVAGARQLVERGARLIVVDDGFQHRRLHRDLDLVCLDTARPFAGGMLPAGDLRELPAALRRADALVLTRAGSFTAEAVAERQAQLRGYVREGVPVWATDHRPVRLVAQPDGEVLPLEAVQGRRVVLLSGIGRPESFVETVRDLGAEVVAAVRRRDHHRHTAAELEEVAALAARRDAVLVTTEKDDAKLDGMTAPRWVLELDLCFLGDGPDPEWLFGAEPAASPPDRSMDTGPLAPDDPPA
ncbi:MAG: tetraacyldisaccharide 4'-kinase [Planctomycetes bacterium]|nr:tetraacyldisaccharide 4'-kinase [Planctomycetota bacterium]